MSRYSRLSIPETKLFTEALELGPVFKVLKDLYSDVQYTKMQFATFQDYLKNSQDNQSSQKDSQIIAPAQLVAIYILIFQIKRIGSKQCLQNILKLSERDPVLKLKKDRVIVLIEKILELSKSVANQSSAHDNLKFLKNLIEELAPLTVSVFEEFQLSKIPAEVSLILSEWLNRRVELLLYDYVPTPEEVLNLQAQGRRMVSIFFEPEIHQSLIAEKCDAYEFCLHDLSHGAKFLLSPHYREQVEFFKQLDRCLIRENFLEKDLPADLRQGIYYVMSDMNSHAQHLHQTLQAHLKPFHFEINLDRFEEQTSD